MKLSSLGAFVGAAVFAAAPSAFAATLINFDDVTGPPTQLTNQYASLGVIFDQIDRAQSFTFNIVPPSAPNYVSPFWNNNNPGAIVFVDPANPNQPAATGSVTITLVGLSTPSGHPGNFSGATIDALDSAGNVIAGQSQIIAATSTATSNVNLTFTGLIHELRFTHAANTTGAFPVDNLTFDALTDVPKPSTAALSLGAFAAIALLLRRASVV